MKSRLRYLSSLLLILSLLVNTSGCVPLAIGAAVGAGGFAWVKGELVNDLNVTAERLHKAVSRAARDLKLAVYEDKGDRLTAKIVAKFIDGTDVHINVQAKTERVTTVKIRVGLLGDKEKSEIIFNAIKRRL